MILPDYWLRRPSDAPGEAARSAFDDLWESAQLGSLRAHIAQLASYTEVQPLARLSVAPADFPFLGQIRGHNDQRLQEYATALQTGAPLPQDP